MPPKGERQIPHEKQFGMTALGMGAGAGERKLRGKIRASEVNIKEIVD